MIHVKERALRDGIEQVLGRVAEIGEHVLAKKFVPSDLRRMDILPLP